MEKQKARIENWFKIGNLLVGDVVGHPKLGDMQEICTSPIINFDLENNTCETRNTIYELGKRHDGTYSN